MRIKDQAICIRHFDWSETSQVVALLTREHGKVRGLAKGSKRTSPGAVARFSGGIELLTLGQIVATTKPTTELASLTEWDLQKPFSHLRSDLTAQRIGLYGADLAGAILADHDPHPAIFDALSDLLAQLDLPRQHELALIRYQWLVLADCGYQPQLERDVHTDQLLADQSTYTFDARAGGITDHTRHGTTHEGAGPWRVRQETVQVLRRLAQGPVDNDRLASPALRRANQLLCVYARSILDRALPTMAFVLNQESQGHRPKPNR